MIDLDIPTPTPGVTTTLHHWFQTNLTSSRKHTTIPNTKFHLLQNVHKTEPLAGYISPQTPALIPLGHTYVLILVDLSYISPEGLEVLKKPTEERVGFDAEVVLYETGVECAAVGTYFIVTNPGPATGSVGGPAAYRALDSGYGAGDGRAMRFGLAGVVVFGVGVSWGIEDWSSFTTFLAKFCFVDGNAFGGP